MKLTYLPLMAVHNILLQYLLFGFISVCVPVKALCFDQDLEQKSSYKQKSCGKSLKIVLVLA